jgi:hypothetical protein
LLPEAIGYQALALVAEGLTARQVAKRLKIARGSVANVVAMGVEGWKARFERRRAAQEERTEQDERERHRQEARRLEAEPRRCRCGRLAFYRPGEEKCLACQAADYAGPRAVLPAGRVLLGLDFRGDREMEARYHQCRKAAEARRREGIVLKPRE